MASKPLSLPKGGMRISLRCPIRYCSFINPLLWVGGRKPQTKNQREYQQLVWFSLRNRLKVPKRSAMTFPVKENVLIGQNGLVIILGLEGEHFVVRGPDVLSSAYIFRDILPAFLLPKRLSCGQKEGFELNKLSVKAKGRRTGLRFQL